VRYIYGFTVFILTVYVVLANCFVYGVAAPDKSHQEASLNAQLGYLQPLMHAGLGARMQAWFPEGNAFSHALYGLSQCACSLRSIDAQAKKDALDEAMWSYRALDSDEVRGPFPKVMEPHCGVFYAGWRNYLLARIIEASGVGVDASLRAEFDSLSAELALAYAGSSSPFLASYDGLAWPADNVVAMASLSLHDRLNGGRERVLIEQWLGQVRHRMDTSGLVPHAWDPLNDAVLEGPRGSSQSLMNCFWPVIDSAMAADQVERYRRRFFGSRLGVPMVREYPKGSSGVGDVDSGPVILGIGSSAMIVAPGAFRMNDDPSRAYALDRSIEGWGVAFGADRKRFAFGLMPIADLFILWTRSMPSDPMIHVAAGSFMAMHLWSVLVLFILWLPITLPLMAKRFRR
jgi:hypothetical protein